MAISRKRSHKKKTCMAFSSVGVSREILDYQAYAFAKDLHVEIVMAAQIRWGFTAFRNASDYIQPKSMKASIFV
ncbi:NADH-dependent flavin oxidoreductase [Penicillium citrinum]|uniref:NADH-dependent flavin oxidoreductase n=1 Tax=Penicillium citrinum TaxID=5077 RepID=A0A9W9TIQ6_PENCI|nr:NADH-dependent flavin oxidoreductase [Penicillium citrinum]KAJ5224163.1 NADH-dependent flavin oxidoreductase [Penicillium citrinum]